MDHPIAAPTYRLEEITRLADVSRRALRYYLQIGLLPRPKPRGAATVYTHEQLVRLKAIVLLRRRDRISLDAVKNRLSSMTLGEMEALVTPPAPPPPAAPPLAATPPASPALPSTPLPASGSAADPRIPCVRWDHIELLPGLELHVRSDAGPLLRRLADEIYTQYAAAHRSPVQPASAGAPGGGGLRRG